MTDPVLAHRDLVLEGWRQGYCTFLWPYRLGNPKHEWPSVRVIFELIFRDEKGCARWIRMGKGTKAGVDRHTPLVQGFWSRVVTPWSVGCWERYQHKLDVSLFVFKSTVVRQMGHSNYRVVAG